MNDHIRELEREADEEDAESEKLEKQQKKQDEKKDNKIKMMQENNKKHAKENISPEEALKKETEPAATDPSGDAPQTVQAEKLRTAPVEAEAASDPTGDAPQTVPSSQLRANTDYQPV